MALAAAGGNLAGRLDMRAAAIGSAVAYLGGQRCRMLTLVAMALNVAICGMQPLPHRCYRAHFVRLRSLLTPLLGSAPVFSRSPDARAPRVP